MLLTQRRPKGIAEELYRNNTGQQIVAESLYFCNLSDGDVAFYIYVGRGESFGKGNALFYKELLDGNETGLIYFSPSGLQMFDNAIVIGVGTSTPNVINFTLMGTNIENRAQRFF